MTPRCKLCRGLLDFAATANHLTSCTSCALKALRASRQGTRAKVMAAADGEWQTFLAAVRSVARPDGTVHQGDVRPLLRGKVAPKHVGTLYRRAKAEGVLSDTGEREPSNDFAGRNGDKLDRVYALTAVAA